MNYIIRWEICKLAYLFVLRHGETDYNVQGRYCGSTDAPLNDTGLRQAQGALATFGNVPVDVIVTSPLMRARQTAQVFEAHFGTVALVIDEFKERGVGVYEGLTRVEAQATYPELWEQNILRQLDNAPPGGESILQVRERVTKGLDTLRSAYPGKNILLVTHGYISKEIHRYFLNLSDEETHAYTLENCAIAEYPLAE